MTGPFVLIVLGILFLLANLHWISRGRLALLFAHYWPVLLILWGVIKLIEYQKAKQEGVPAPGIGAGGVILLIMLIIAGLTASQVAQVNWGELKDEWDIGDDNIPFLGESFDYDEQTSHALPAGAAVKIVNDRGAVNVNVSDNEKIEISAHKKIRADAREDADKWNEQTKTQVNVSGNLVTINANSRGAGDHPVLVDLSISIPRKAAVTIASQRGDINLMGRDGNVDIANQRGDINLDDINGNVNVNTDRGSVRMNHSSLRVTQVSGDVAVQGRSDEVTISDVKGAVRLNGDISDSLKLSKIGKSVSFKSSRTDLEFARLGGDLDLDADSLRADNLTGPLHVTTRSKDVSLDGVSGDARIQNENSSIQFGMKSAGNLQIDNRNGDITVGVPEKLGFKVEARSRGGEVQADFQGLNVANDDREGRASGTVGNGAIHLVLNSEHGNITIRRGELQGAHSMPEIPGTPPPPKPPKPSSKAPSDEPTEN
jgi:DUF4097 and DUF4098 domain-containing protein YvlB